MKPKRMFYVLLVLADVWMVGHGVNTGNFGLVILGAAFAYTFIIVSVTYQ